MPLLSLRKRQHSCQVQVQ